MKTRLHSTLALALQPYTDESWLAADAVLEALGLDDPDAATERAAVGINATYGLPPDEVDEDDRRLGRAALRAALVIADEDASDEEELWSHIAAMRKETRGDGLRAEVERLRLARIMDLEDVLGRIVGPPALNMLDPANGDVRREAQAILSTTSDEGERQ